MGFLLIIVIILRNESAIALLWQEHCIANPMAYFFRWTVIGGAFSQAFIILKFALTDSTTVYFTASIDLQAVFLARRQ